MENIQIRKAVTEDLPILFQFEQGIIETERPFDPTFISGEFHYYDLKKLIESDDAEVMVAVLNGEVIGSGSVRIKQANHFNQFSEYAFLGFMYVKPSQRGKGINKLIIDALVEWARKRGFREVRLKVYSENTSAIAAYEKVGFSKLLTEMRLTDL